MSEIKRACLNKWLQLTQMNGRLIHFVYFINGAAYNLCYRYEDTIGHDTCCESRKSLHHSTVAIEGKEKPRVTWSARSRHRASLFASVRAMCDMTWKTNHILWMLRTSSPAEHQGHKKKSTIHLILHASTHPVNSNNNI